MLFPQEIFLVDDNCKTLEQVQEVLQPLNLQWHVQENDQGGKSAIAFLYKNEETKEVWAVAVLEKAHSTRHRHNNPDGIYGEINFTLAGILPDKTDEGRSTAHVKGSILCHAGGTVHESVYTDFWAGVYHQPLGSTALPKE